MSDYWLSYYVGKQASWELDGWEIHVGQPDAFRTTSRLLGKGIQTLAIVPVVGALFNIGVYSWTLIVALFFSLRARARIGWLLLPYVALMVGLGLTPLNGSTRYAFGLFAAFPFFVSIAIHAARNPGKRAARIAA